MLVIVHNILWVYKFGKNIRREDKCSRKELEEYMDESISHIQICENKSYYVVYRQDQEQGRKVFKNIAYCDKDLQNE